ncbi:hypothetical protein D3C76_338000 [compost metagenome]
MDWERVADYIREIRKHETINNFFYKLESYGDIVIIGGSIRDIVVNGKNPRDIDIILDTEAAQIDDVFEGMEYTKNRFGGYKAVFNQQEFDVWSITNNWAFKRNILDATIENIPKGCFYNLDATYFNLSTGLGDAQYFSEALFRKQLDIVLDDEFIYTNPFPEINIVRAIVLKKEYDVTYSKKVETYIKWWLDKSTDPFYELKNAGYKHYKKRGKVSTNEIRSLIDLYGGNLATV